MLRWLRHLLHRSGASMTVTVPAGFQEGDAILRPDGWYEWVDGRFQPMKPDKP